MAVSAGQVHLTAHAVGHRHDHMLPAGHEAKRIVLERRSGGCDSDRWRSPR